MMCMLICMDLMIHALRPVNFDLVCACMLILYVVNALSFSYSQDPTEGVDYFVLTPTGDPHYYTVPIENSSLYDDCPTNKTLQQHNIDFNLVQIIAGDIVSVTFGL